MIEVPIAHGELYDKLSILKIKSMKGLEVKSWKNCLVFLSLS
jgi:hypothetical protein